MHSLCVACARCAWRVAAGKEKDAGRWNTTGQLLNMLLERVQVTVKSVHVRIEDWRQERDFRNVRSARPAKRYAVGLTLQRLHVRTTELENAKEASPHPPRSYAESRHVSMVTPRGSDVRAVPRSRRDLKAGDTSPV